MWGLEYRDRIVSESQWLDPTLASTVVVQYLHHGVSARSHHHFIPLRIEGVGTHLI